MADTLLPRDPNQHGVVTLTLTGPEHCGVLGAARAGELTEMLLATGRDPDVEALLITGVGDVFATGRDDLPEVRRLVETLRDHPLPTFAAVQRACIGAGLAVALACQRRFIAENAVLCPSPGSQLHGVTGTLLTEAVGPDVARRLLGLGALEPDELVRWGIPATLVPDSHLLAAARDAARHAVTVRPGAPVSFLTAATSSVPLRGVRSRRGVDAPVNLRSAPAPGRSSSSEGRR